MTKIIKISSILLLVSISTIFISKISFLGPLKISDYFLLASFLFFVTAILEKEIDISEERKKVLYVVICFGAILLGTIASFFILRFIPTMVTIKEYCHIIMDALFLIETIVISNYDKNFPKKALLSFLFSLLIIPLLYIPNSNQYFLYGNTRFKGLSLDPNFFVNFQIIPTLLILFFILKDNKKAILKVFLFILFCFSVGLILWSGSRSGLMGLLVSFGALIFLLIPKMSKKRLAVIIFLILISFPVGFYIIPRKSENDIKLRVNNIQKTDAGVAPILDFASGQDRLNIWKNALFFVIKNPLGYGPGYYELIDIHGDGLDNRVSHNFELELLLTGGIGLFLLVNFALLKTIIKSIKNCRSAEFNEIYILLPILLGVLTSSMFLDTLLYSKWLWVIVALIIVYNRQMDLTEGDLI